MKKSNSQVINTFLIIAGAALLIFEISESKENVYFLVAGIIMLMFGLYRATNHWVETKDDHKEGDETDENRS